MRKARPAVPTESDEQIALFRWAAYETGAHPELSMLYHIPNERRCTARQGARMNAEGRRKGVPDICLPVPKGGYHGLYIELKRTKGGTVSDDQKGWIKALQRCGYRAEVCRGWEPAMKVIMDYLEG